jgi:precorrin-6B C5,15-methyltransferase / cobalt-precorrin-6B C5,C15-methyltransferase
MSPWLAIIGVGEDGFVGLSPVARTLIQTAEVLIGGERHLAMIPLREGTDDIERLAWPSPIAPLVERIPKMRGKRVCVLATGDPMCFGIGTTLARLVAPEEMSILPGVSAFALAAARLIWPLDSVETINLQGRPVEQLALHVYPGARLLILSHDARSPAAVAAWLAEHGFGASPMIALAHMGGIKEERVEASATDWKVDVPDFHTLAVQCIASPDARWWPRTAGLPDAAFEHDGKLTKREFRALALAKLVPHPGALLWDIGAGCGSVGIEWMRAARHAQAIAIEPIAERRAMIARNAAALGVPALDIRDARAPEGLTSLPPPDAVFVGGGLSEQSIDDAIDALKPGGRLVAHAVTLESEGILLAAYARHRGELVRLTASHAEPIGGFSGWRPLMPITQFSWRKP